MAYTFRTDDFAAIPPSTFVTINSANLNEMKSLIADAAAAGSGMRKNYPIVVEITIDATEYPFSGTNSGGEDPLHKLYDAIPNGKYVAYDLSGCTFTRTGYLYDWQNNYVEARTNRRYLASITLPDTLRSIDHYAFSGCSGLTSVTIPNSVTSLGSEAFYGCSSLTSVTIGNSVTSIESRAFYDCSGLTSVTIPNSVTSLGYEAFGGCSGLTSVTIGNGVTSLDGLFLNVNLKDQLLPGSFEWTLEYLIDRTDLSLFDLRYDNDEKGAPAYHPAVLLKIIFYCYSRGIVTSRPIEQAAKTSIVVKALAADVVNAKVPGTKFASVPSKQRG
ncbi:hypothetical protein FACS189473_5520 [Spirochaetia bacterium]|nr:hypothetical protein FACS189473_5520 [Spirochaetia bacterium]